MKPTLDVDSLNLSTMMKDVLAYAKKGEGKPFYKKSLKLWSFDYDSEAELNYGKPFSLNEKYLVVHRKLYNTVVAIDVLKPESGKFNKVVSQSLDNNSFIESGIKDINGDGLKDFYIHWYPTSGCCRRDVYDVYLFQKESGRFENSLQFINPTFSPKEHLVRGVEYGHPGDVGLYKYKWDGLKLDTVEFIFPDSTGIKFYLSKKRDFGKSGKLLMAVPEEYHKIKSYDWFRGIY